MITVATFQSVDEAHLARMRLEGSGIDAVVADENMVQTFWFYSNAIGGVRMQVREEDHAAAIEVLGLVPVKEGLIECPNCGSTKIGHRKLSLLSAPSFLVGAFIPVASSH